MVLLGNPWAETGAPFTRKTPAEHSGDGAAAARREPEAVNPTGTDIYSAGRRVGMGITDKASLGSG